MFGMYTASCLERGIDGLSHLLPFPPHYYYCIFRPLFFFPECVIFNIMHKIGWYSGKLADMLNSTGLSFVEEFNMV